MLFDFSNPPKPEDWTEEYYEIALEGLKGIHPHYAHLRDNDLKEINEYERLHGLPLTR